MISNLIGKNKSDLKPLETKIKQKNSILQKIEGKT